MDEADPRAPAWAAGIMAAGFPALLVIFWDGLEGRIGRAIGVDGGPTPLLMIVALFVLTWGVTVPVLLRSMDPIRSAWQAGAWVSLLILMQLGSIAEFLILVVVIGIPFVALTFALALLAGGFAQRAQSGTPQRGIAAMAFAMGCIFALAAIPFLPGIGGPMVSPGPLVGVVAVVGLLIGGGAWLWRPS